MGVQTKSRRSGRQASDRYAEAMERALGLSCPPTLGQIRRIRLSGGCILYDIPPLLWRRNRLL